MPSKRNLLAQMCLLCLTCLCGSSHADAVVDLRLTAGHDSLINQSNWEPMQARVRAAELALSRSVVVDAHSGWVLRANVALEQVDPFEKLNSVLLGATAVYRIQPLAGFTEPWYEAEMGLDRRQFSDSPMRDGNAVHLNALVGRRLTDRVRTRAGLGVQRRWARESSVFDLSNQSVFADATVRTGDASSVFVRLGRVWGDQVLGGDPPPVAGAAVPSWWTASYAAARARGRDPIFADDWWAYRSLAVATTLSAGLNLPVGNKLALSLDADRSIVAVHGGTRYNRSVVSASMLYRY